MLDSPLNTHQLQQYSPSSLHYCNAVEGWHRRFQANVEAYHPNVWKFIDILKREQSLNHVNISQVRAGHQPEPQRRH